MQIDSAQNTSCVSLESFSSAASSRASSVDRKTYAQDEHRARMLAAYPSPPLNHTMPMDDMFTLHGVEITRAQRSDVREISCLVSRGFREIFSWVGADNEKAAAMATLELEYNFKSCWGKVGVARAQGEDAILGAIFLVTDADQKRRLDAPLRTYLNILGFFGTFRFKKLRFLRDPRVKPNECYISWIVVREDSRGKGVGSVLLAWAEDRARDMMKKSLMLYVANTSRAKKLYQRLGYQEAFVKRVFCLSPIFWCTTGYFLVKSMRKILPVDEDTRV
eukprot:GEMP01002194.1.p1 GENE.GEMP01002194.1~~GEMP01002194.1.p1  ORF type:complete len:277 (+),score=25.11 GEMP01002194.1:300-1130(+)